MPTIIFTITDKKVMESMIRSLPHEFQSGFKVQIDYDQPPFQNKSAQKTNKVPFIKKAPGLTNYHNQIMQIFQGREGVSKKEIQEAAEKLNKSPGGVSQLLTTLQKHGLASSAARNQWSFK